MMIISNDDFETKKFPYPESERTEYKESIVDLAFDKYLQTICGFLNSGGGNLIFGIKDNLNLIGINSKNKCVDKFILRIDTIISEKQIIGLNNESGEFTNIEPSNIKSRQIVNKSGKKFLIIEVQSSTQSNIIYQLANGMIYHRLGASNYFEKTERIYKQTDFESACKNIIQKATFENKTNIQLFQKTLLEKEKHINVLNEKIKELEKNNIMQQKYIENILTSMNKNKNIENQIINNDSSQIIISDYNVLIKNILHIIFSCF